MPPLVPKRTKRSDQTEPCLATATFLPAPGQSSPEVILLRLYLHQPRILLGPLVVRTGLLCHCQAPVPVSSEDGGCFSRSLEFLICILPDGLRHPVAHYLALMFEGYQRLVDEAR